MSLIFIITSNKKKGRGGNIGPFPGKKKQWRKGKGQEQSRGGEKKRGGGVPVSLIILRSWDCERRGEKRIIVHYERKGEGWGVPLARRGKKERGEGRVSLYKQLHGKPGFG